MNLNKQNVIGNLIFPWLERNGMFPDTTVGISVTGSVRIETWHKGSTISTILTDECLDGSQRTFDLLEGHQEAVKRFKEKQCNQPSVE